MKNFRFFLFTLAMLLLCNVANAQLSFKAGLNKVLYQTTVRYTNHSETYYLKGTGVSAGLDYALPLLRKKLGNKFYIKIAPGLNYEYSQAFEEHKLNILNWEVNVSATLKEHYISAPLLFNFGYSLNGDWDLFIYTGPIVEYRIKTKLTMTTSSKLLNNLGEYLGLDKEGSVEDGNNDRFNYVLSSGIGVKYLSYKLSFGYYYGLKASKYYFSDTPGTYRSQFGLTFAYEF